MHTFIKHRDDYYTVGFASTEYKREFDRIIGWYPIKDVKDEETAIEFVRILNGGSK